MAALLCNKPCDFSVGGDYRKSVLIPANSIALGLNFIGDGFCGVSGLQESLWGSVAAKPVGLLSEQAPALNTGLPKVTAARGIGDADRAGNRILCRQIDRSPRGIR